MFCVLSYSGKSFGVQTYVGRGNRNVSLRFSTEGHKISIVLYDQRRETKNV
jgi:hypothetical protein